MILHKWRQKYKLSVQQFQIFPLPTQKLTWICRGISHVTARMQALLRSPFFRSALHVPSKHTTIRLPGHPRALRKTGHSEVNCKSAEAARHFPPEKNPAFLHKPQGWQGDNTAVFSISEHTTAQTVAIPSLSGNTSSLTLDRLFTQLPWNSNGKKLFLLLKSQKKAFWG